MTLEIEAGGRRHAIEVRQSGGDWIVSIDGRTYGASLVQVGPRWSLLVRSEGGRSGEAPGAAARSYEVSVDARGSGDRAVTVEGREVIVSLLDPRSAGGRPRVATAEADGPGVVASPMPGRVVKILVARGDPVAARQGLVIVEAMKMENELRSPRAGRVTEVRVREGEPVEANTVLIVIGR